ncbi:carboxymuconolactone decarboxylase family protein [Aliivibrio fischeri]|uniref:carboxymuconolactone decarboxylase family protein n=1 Tax=Aliivibrio fischeri TaxID=668 RepID=UPI0012D883A2|nr:carboxymuconolactone decarboxylase family protein [Aliivibrio fischeri]MUK61906.1 carboxymuconolactone decarboxylase family protein [Aliivibrio fischeri]MUK69343.1 carboxymuconolactone decarboxylase family protein [Aliivibrio fischeri]MUK75092.1 carboxymuconolactone decarboxylase family protein [Aliivibrio fischeri]MUK75338.1 carboxymuconolactone decarboxylase family protein [Aliivibrio fischeri]MUL21823.1 carboxymuconolactone decarboxylase family protein [Aliivibrio fischeri]
MTTRIDIAKIQPTALSAMLSIESYLSSVNLSAELKELIKIRASMINQCAYCIQMHVPEAEKAGIESQKLFALAAWKESPLFNATERAILALTDEMTLIANDGVSDKSYQEALDLLGEEQLAQAMMQVIMINAWNRFALATQMTH